MFIEKLTEKDFLEILEKVIKARYEMNFFDLRNSSYVFIPFMKTSSFDEKIIELVFNKIENNKNEAKCLFVCRKITVDYYDDLTKVIKVEGEKWEQDTTLKGKKITYNRSHAKPSFKISDFNMAQSFYNIKTPMDNKINSVFLNFMYKKFGEEYKHAYLKFREQEKDNLVGNVYGDYCKIMEENFKEEFPQAYLKCKEYELNLYKEETDLNIKDMIK